MTPEEFRAAGHRVVDWIADYRERVGSLPVASSVAPGEVRSLLPDHAPSGPDGIDELLADLDRVVLPGLTHWQSPGFFAYFPANAALSSVLGDLTSSGLGVNGFSWVTSPAVTEVELAVMDWMVELLGLPDRFRGNGCIQDSASGGTLCAVLAARERAVRAGAPLDRLVAYATAQAHSSVEKALRVAGFAPERCRTVAHDAAFAMDVADLADRMASDVAEGLVPCFVATAAGTTSSEAFDPVDEVAEVAHRHGAWVHLDAAMCGIAGLCPELRRVHRGVEDVDSYLTNGHKWMGVVFDCTFFWVADPEPLLQALSILPEYLRSDAAQSGAARDLRDWQVPLGRRFRALKVWFLLRLDGVESVRAMIRSHVEWARQLETWVRADDRFEVLAPVSMNLVCLALRAGDDATQQLVEAVNASGEALVTPTVLDGRRVLRVCIGAQHTERHDVEALWSLIRRTAPAG